MTGDVSLSSFILFLIIFVWTPPHFWALALVKAAEYGRAGVPMMPNAKGFARTRLEILVYTALLAPVGALPWFMGFASAVYGAIALVSGAGLLWLAWDVYRVTESKAADRAAMKLFGYSILYLFALFAVIVAERGLARVLA